MYILVIMQSNGATIKPLKANNFDDAKSEEAVILANGYSKDSIYNSEIVQCHDDGTTSQTCRDKNPMTGHKQEAIWETRNCAFVAQA